MLQTFNPNLARKFLTSRIVILSKFIESLSRFVIICIKFVIYLSYFMFGNWSIFINAMIQGNDVKDY